MIIHDLELKISKLLRIGVMIAGLIIFCRLVVVIDHERK